VEIGENCERFAASTKRKFLSFPTSQENRQEEYMKKLYMILPLALILCFMVGCQDKEEMAELEEFRAQAAVEEQNKELMRKLVEEWNKGSNEYYMQLMASDYAFYTPSGNPNSMSREEAAANLEAFWKGFPDLTFSIEEMIAKGDRLTTRWIGRGTHEGEFMGIPATGKKIEFSGLVISHIQNGKLIEDREDADILGLMQQLGMELKPKEKE
jgi:steroid delta-isomerase-like uncharacterized protein